MYHSWNYTVWNETACFESVAARTDTCMTNGIHSNKLTGSCTLSRQTANFKLQKKLLESIAILCVKLDVSSDAELLAHACIPYLSNEQPIELVQTCQTSLASLVRRNPDTLWLILQQLCPQQVPVPPHPTLKPFQVCDFIMLCVMLVVCTFMKLQAG